NAAPFRPAAEFFMRTDTPRTVYLKDYQPPAWLVDKIDLLVRIFDDRTLVNSVTCYRRNGDTDVLALNAEHMKITSVRCAGRKLPFEYDGRILTLEAPDDEFALEIACEIDPASNTRLEGLYK